jgi:hypothetical protein
MFGSTKTEDPEEPIRYQQQKTPTRQDTIDAQSRAETSRRKATKTLLATTEDEDTTAKKTLLGTP